MFVFKRAAVVLALVVALMGVTTVAANAHHPVVDGTYVCNTTTGKFDLTYTVKSDADYNKDWYLTSVSTTPAGLNLSWNRPTGTATDDQNSFIATVSGVAAGSYTLSVTAKWHKKGNPSKDVATQSGSKTLKPSGTCTQKVTAVGHTVTPPTCTTDGLLSIKQQPTGVIVKVNGNAVNPPWSTSTPGVYNVTYSASSGYTLTNNPSGTAEVKGQLGVEHCTKPATTITVDCNGFVVGLTNTGGKVPATFTITKPDGSTEQVVVPAGGSATRTYPVIEDQTATVTVTASGMKTVTKSYHADCVAPAPSPPKVTVPTCTNTTMTVTPGTQPSDTWSPSTPTVLAPGQSVTYTVTPANPNQSYPAGTKTMWSFANTFDVKSCVTITPPVKKVRKAKATVQTSCAGQAAFSLNTKGSIQLSTKFKLHLKKGASHRIKVVTLKPGVSKRIVIGGLRPGTKVWVTVPALHKKFPATKVPGRCSVPNTGMRVAASDSVLRQAAMRDF